MRPDSKSERNHDDNAIRRGRFSARLTTRILCIASNCILCRGWMPTPVRQPYP